MLYRIRLFLEFVYIPTVIENVEKIINQQWTNLICKQFLTINQLFHLTE